MASNNKGSKRNGNNNSKKAEIISIIEDISEQKKARTGYGDSDMASVIRSIRNGKINIETKGYDTRFYYANREEFHGSDIPPLIWAIKYNNPRLVRLLLDIGADPNLKLNAIATVYIDYPLQYATNKIVQQGVNLENIKIVNMLIEAGADIKNYRDKDQIIGIFYNIKGVPTNKGELKDEYDKFENYIFSNIKLTPEEQGQKLHRFASLNPEFYYGQGVVPMVRLLLKHNFDINAPIRVYVPAPPGKYIGTTRESTVYKEAKDGKYNPIINEIIIGFVNRNMVIRLGVNQKFAREISEKISSFVIPPKKPKVGGKRKTRQRRITKKHKQQKLIL